MNNKSLLIASLLLGMASGGASAFGGPGPGGGAGPQGDGQMPCQQGQQGRQGGMGQMHMGHGVLAVAYRVDNLTADQRKQLDALRDKERQLFAANRDDRQALRDAMNKGADAATIRPLAEKEGKHVTEMIMQQVELRGQVNKILNEAQRAQLQEQLADRGEQRDRRGRNR